MSNIARALAHWLPFPKTPCPWCARPITKLSFRRRHFIGLSECPHCGKYTELTGLHSGLALYIALLVGAGAALKPLFPGKAQSLKMAMALLIVYLVLWCLTAFWVGVRRYRP